MATCTPPHNHIHRKLLDHYSCPGLEDNRIVRIVEEPGYIPLEDELILIKSLNATRGDYVALAAHWEKVAAT